MKLRSASIALAGTVILAACADQAPAPLAPSVRATVDLAASTKYIVEFIGETAPADFAAGVAALGGTVESILDGTGLAIVSASAADFETSAERIAGVFAVTPDITLQYIDPNQRVAEAAVNSTDDIFYPVQWHLDAVDAPEAWATGATGAGARVAILDGGLYANHVDLRDNVDRAASRSFVPTTVPRYEWDQDLGTFWHGTHVAGIVAAADNKVGVLGVAPKATLIGVKVLHGGSGDFTWLIGAIRYASTPRSAGGAGADIINMSLGAVIDGKPDDQGDRKDTKAFLRVLDKTMAYAIKNGTTVIASAGNSAIDFDSPDAKDLVSIPADSRHVIAISATAPEGWALGGRDYATQTSYTNYGKRLIDLAAPGGDGRYPGNQNCTVPLNGGFRTTAPCFVFDYVLSTSRGSLNPAATGGYSWAAGTSMASPVAAGIAALIVERNGGPMQPAQVEAALRQSSLDLGKPGFDAVYGHGWVNAARAVGAESSTIAQQ